jgi:hypothetical protein
MPTTAMLMVVVLIGLGLFLPFLSQLSKSLVSTSIPLTLTCRGPPSRRS